MKKSIWLRTISMLLTFAMAFSLFAMPASAASSSNWAVHNEFTTDSGKKFVGWFTKEWWRDWAKEKYPSASDAKIEAALNEVQKKYEGTPNFWTEDIPDNAYFGISEEVNSTKVYWYTKGVYELMEKYYKAGYEDITSFEYGVIFYSNGTKLYPIGYTGDKNDSVAMGYFDKGAFIWITEKIFVEEIMKASSSSYSKEMIQYYMVATMYEAEQEGYEVMLYMGTIPDDAYMGLSKQSDGTIFWYTEENYNAMRDVSLDEFNDSTGIVTNSDGSEVTPIGYVAPSISNEPSDQSDSDSDAFLGVLAVGAVAIVATVYFMNRDVMKTENISHNLFLGEKSVVIIKSEVTGEAQSKIQTIANGQKLVYFDVNCSNLTNSMELIVPVNTFLRSNFKVYRVVNGKATELTRLDSHPEHSAQRLEGSYYVDGGTIYIYSKQPAEYAIGYNGLF